MGSHSLEEEVSLITMSILSILLIISELLAWSSCKPNSITEYLYSKLACSVEPDQDDNTVATQTPSLQMDATGSIKTP